MCIINREVIQVMATAILVLKSHLGDRQLTVYSNNVATKRENEMILPFPLRFAPGEKDELLFHDIANAKSVFDDLKNEFYRPVSMRNFLRTNVYSLDFKEAVTEAVKIIEVHDVGSYLASKVYSVEDFKYLNSSVFKLDLGVEKLMQANYNTGYGFIVCKLKASSVGAKYEPFAYSHYTSTSHPNQLFIPTKHYHSHHADNSDIKENMEANWDHDIFIYNYQAGLPWKSSIDWRWSGHRPTSFHEVVFLANMKLDNALNFKRISTQGRRRNIDLRVKVY